MLRDLFARQRLSGFAQRSRPRGPRDRRCSIERLERRELPTVLPAGFVETTVASGLARPSAMEFAPDGRIFVAEQGGRLRVIKEGTLLASPFLTVNVDSAGERGLLGVAFDPNFATNRFVYIYYTVATTPVHNRVSRFTANGDVAVPGSEVVILKLNDLSTATNHNGGAIHFGPDGKLYVGVGENANGPNAQSLNNLLGKVLRINADGTIPGDNPFVNSATGVNRAIWALGLRNPFAFAFQPGTSRVFINDVGQNRWEEINDGVAGANYGWPATEGPTNDPRFKPPLFSYGHGDGDTLGRAITGGAFYNPSTVQFPGGYVNGYFFADFTSRWIRSYDPATDAVAGFATDLPDAPVDLKVDAAGSLYYLARGGGGVVGRIEFRSAPSEPVNPPVAPPVNPPVAPPTNPPVTPPINPPVAPPVNPPVVPPVNPPVAPPVNPPVVPPVNPPVVPPVNDPIAPAPVRVQAVRLQLRRGVVRGVVLTFSDLLDVPRAQNLARYRLTLAGRDGRVGTRDDRTALFGAVTYDPGTRTVSLVPARRLTLNRRSRLTVDGSTPSGVADRFGRLIDGDADGQAGGDFVTPLRRQNGPSPFRAASSGSISARAVDALFGAGHPLADGNHAIDSSDSQRS